MNRNEEILQPFHEAQDQQLTAVLRSGSEEGEEIILAFSTHALIFSCDEDADVIRLRWEQIAEVEDAEDLTADPAWSRFVGQFFFWGWLTLNQRGLFDGALLSFGGVVPEIGLSVVAGEFEILEVRQRPR